MVLSVNMAKLTQSPFMQSVEARQSPEMKVLKAQQQHVYFSEPRTHARLHPRSLIHAPLKNILRKIQSQCNR